MNSSRQPTPSIGAAVRAVLRRSIEVYRDNAVAAARVRDQLDRLVQHVHPPEVADEVYARAEGNPFFTEQLVAAALAGAAGDRLGVPAGLPGRLAELLAEGRSTRHIAQQLNISMKTVEFHKANITRKLGVHTTSDLIKFALAQGITTLQF